MVVVAIISMFACALLIVTNEAWGEAALSASLEVVRQDACKPAQKVCTAADAIVFVHGIYGGDGTFLNSTTNFDWPRHLPTHIANRAVDIFRLNYTTALLAWAKEKNPDFPTVAKDIYAAMTPLRKRQYRSIGFIAHSLGGNVVSTYIHMVKTTLGHPQRSQHAFVITLATPVLGSHIADLADVLKSTLNINDDLLKSLMKDDLYLRMLLEFRKEENAKQAHYSCRPVHLHAAFEEKYLGPLLIVNRDSAALSISDIADSRIVGFPLNHSAIAKPDGPTHDVYRWVLSRIDDEYSRLSMWEASHTLLPPKRRLCELIDFVPEGDVR